MKLWSANIWHVTTVSVHVHSPISALFLKGLRFKRLVCIRAAAPPPYQETHTHGQLEMKGFLHCLPSEDQSWLNNRSIKVRVFHFKQRSIHNCSVGLYSMRKFHLPMKSMRCDWKLQKRLGLLSFCQADNVVVHYLMSMCGVAVCHIVFCWQDKLHRCQCLFQRVAKIVRLYSVLNPPSERGFQILWDDPTSTLLKQNWGPKGLLLTDFRSVLDFD